jgi:hypothetical protein
MFCLWHANAFHVNVDVNADVNVHAIMKASAVLLAIPNYSRRLVENTATLPDPSSAFRASARLSGGT